MSEVSEEALLEFFGSSGGGSGRLRNADLLRTFKPFIGHPDPQLRGKFTDQPIVKQKQKQTRTKANQSRTRCACCYNNLRVGLKLSFLGSDASWMCVCVLCFFFFFALLFGSGSASNIWCPLKLRFQRG